MSVSARPLVSVLTPSFNQARWLAANLESVAAQTYRPVEHIVMDGGSTDRTVELLERTAGDHVRWRSEPDDGQSDALLRALEASSGDVIAWLNSDDTFADRRTLEWVVEALYSGEGADMVVGHVLDTTADDMVIRVTLIPPLWTRRLHRDLLPLKQPGVFFRRSAIEGNFVRRDLHFAMDHEVLHRLLRQGHAVRRIPRVLATNRHQPMRKSIGRGDRYASEYEEVRAERSALDRLHRRAAHHLVAHPTRLAGTWTFLALDRRLDRAGPLELPSRGARLKFQLATRIEPYVAQRASTA